MRDWKSGNFDTAEGDSPIFVERKSGQSPAPNPYRTLMSQLRPPAAGR
jgi:hypothetical protein